MPLLALIWAERAKYNSRETAHFYTVGQVSQSWHCWHFALHKFLLWGLSCACRMYSSIPGLQPLNTSSTLPNCDNQKCPQYCQVSSEEVKLLQVGNRCCKEKLVGNQCLMKTCMCRELTYIFSFFPNNILRSAVMSLLTDGETGFRHSKLWDESDFKSSALSSLCSLKGLPTISWELPILSDSKHFFPC